MRQTWRWFGPSDLARIDDIVQAGAQGVVTALHHIANGEVWTPEEIARRQEQVRRMNDGDPSGIEWEVVESLPVSEDIKRQTGDWREHIESYKLSLANLASAGIETVCYNFMPVLDWTRTDLVWRLPNRATCMRFEEVDFAAFDIHILERAGAADDFPEEVVKEARRRFDAFSEEQKTLLTNNIVAGLPGANEHLSLEGVREHLAAYGKIGPDTLRAHFIDFLSEVVPAAEELGLRLCCHPDDPPFALLGLPRVVSTEADYAALMEAVDLPANGITLCSGSLGARPDNDLPGMMQRLGHRVHFLHLRNVRRETGRVGGSFYESEHLGGDVDLVSLIHAVVAEEARRRKEGRADHQIPMRPDHGQDILDDLDRRAQPGYPTIGRLKGLAEIRGVMQAFEHSKHGMSV